MSVKQLKKISDVGNKNRLMAQNVNKSNVIGAVLKQVRLGK